MKSNLLHYFSVLLVISLSSFLSFSQITVQTSTTSTSLTQQGGGGPSACNPGNYSLKMGAATSGSCLVMTPPDFSDDGSAAWVCDPIDLDSSFKMTTEVTFGSNPAQGDGIVFVLKTNSSPNVYGGVGGNIGYHNPGPAGVPIGESLGIEFDTYYLGPGDSGLPADSCDHAQMVQDGDLTSKIGGQTCLVPDGSTVVDGLSHQICIIWDAANNIYQAYFDGNLVIDYTGDIRGFFASPNSVYWGFTAGDGGASNQNNHEICNTVMLLTNATLPAPFCIACAAPVLVVNPLPAICNGTTIDLATAVDPSSDPGVLSYHTSLTDAQNDVNPISSIVGSAGTYYIRLEDSGDPTCFSVESVVVTVNPLPVITNSPTTDEICSGGTTSITFTSDVAGTTYSWTAVGSSGNVSGFNASGSGNVSETLTNSGTAVETVTYTVTPTGPSPTFCVGTPVDFVVAVNPIPTITNATLTEEFCSGGTTGIVPTADVAGTTFTWTAVGSSGNVSGFGASGSGNITETLTNSGSTVETVTYTVTPVGPGTPTCPGTPVDFVVTVNPIPTITNATLTEEFCSGGTTGIIPTSDVAGTTFTWTAVGSSGNVSGFSASGSGNISETLTNSGTAVETVTYTVTPTGPATTLCVGTPVDFIVTVNPIPTITNVTLTEEFCSGGTTGIVPTADVAGTTFTWTAVGSSGNISGFSASGTGNITETLTNSGTATETVTYTVTPVGPGTPTCPGSPVDFVVTVNPAPAITNATTTDEFCSGGTTAFVPTSNIAGTTFDWVATASSGNVTGYSASGSGNISETLTNSGTAVETVTYTVTPTGPATTFCVGIPVDFIATVNPVPAITNATLTEEICSGGTTGITPTADVAGTTFTWTAVGSSGNVTGFSASGSGNITETLTNSGTAIETVTYTVTPTGPSPTFCVGTPVDFVVTVNPIPTITNATLTEEFCSGGTTGIVPTADIAGTTFTWTAVGSSGNVSGFSSSGSGNISETLTNSGTTVETVTYTVTPVGPSPTFCVGTPVDFVVTVNPVPTITNATLTEEICSGGTTGIVPTADVAGTVFTWTAVGSSGNVSGFSASGSGNITETLTNSGTVVETVTYTVIPVGPGTPTCPGTPVDFVVTVNPIPTITNATLTEEFCSGGTTGIVPTADVAGTTFTWTAAGSSGNVSGFSASGSGNITETLTNSGSSVETVTYTVTPVGPGTPTCPGTPVDFVVTVNPAPTITNATLTEEFCSGGTTGIVPTADVAGTTFTWTAVGSSGNVTGYSASGNGNISETLTNSGSAIETVTYTVTPTGPATTFCAGTPVDFVVTVNPIPNLTVQDSTGCSPFAINLTDPTYWNTDIGTLSYFTDAGLTTPLADPTSVGPGTYYIEADNLGCTTSAAVTLTETASPVIATVGTDPTFCSATDGTIEVTLSSGATSSGTLSWTGTASGSNGAADITADSPDIINLGAGTYNVTFTDANGCVSNTSTLALNNPGAPILDPIASVVSCLDYTLDLTTVTGTNLVNPQYYTATGGPAGAGVLIPDGTTFTPFTNTTIYVYDENGSCSAEVQYNVTINITPTLTLQDSTTCSPNTVNLSDVTYWSTDVGTMTWYSDAGLTTILPSTNVGAGTYYVEADNAGCTSSGSVNIVVNTTPTLTVQDTTTCSPNTVNLTDVTYWSTDVGTMSYFESDGVTPIVDATIVGAGTYVLEADNLGCVSTANVTVTVNTTPTLTVQDTTTCSPNTVNLTDATYWSTDVGTITYFESDGVTPIADATIVGAGTYVLEADNLGCVSTANVMVTVNTTPMLTVQDTTTCSPNTVNLTDVTYWSTDVGTMSYFEADGVTPIADATMEGAGTYVLEADNLGCVSTAIVTVTVNTTPTLTVQDTTTCSPNTVDLTDVTYWSTDVGTISYFESDGVTPIANATVVGAGTYVLEADNLGCVSTANVLVTVNTTPTLTVQDTTTCSPTTVNLTDASYWSTDVGTMSYFESDGVTPVADATTAGAGTYVLEADNLGCVSTVSVTVTVITTPTLTVQDTATCSPNTVDLTDLTYWSTDVGTLSYFESDGLTPIADATITGAGTYVLEADNLGCISTASVTVTVNTTPTLTLQDTTDCSPFTVDLSDVAYWSTDVGTLTWYSDAGLTTVLPSTSVGAGTYYAQADNAGCTASGSVLVTEVTTPDVDPLGPVSACDAYTLPAITGTSLSGTQAYYTGTGGTGTSYNAGDAINTAGLTTLYIYDGAAGCSDEEQLNITITITPTITVTNPSAVCEPNTVDISGSASADVGTLVWYSDAGLTTPVADPTQVSTGTYYVEADNGGCTSSDMVTVTVNPVPPAPTAGTDSTYCSAWTLENMMATGTGGTMTWYDDQNNVLGTGGTYMPASAMGTVTYYVTETLAGCEGSSSMVTITIEDCDISIPTAFSPNNDMINDVWSIANLDAVHPDNTVRIYNRWGNLIFENISSGGSNPYAENQWDGTYNGEALPVGSYYYVIELLGNEKITETGAVSIILSK